MKIKSDRVASVLLRQRETSARLRALRRASERPARALLVAAPGPRVAIAPLGGAAHDRRGACGRRARAAARDGTGNQRPRRLVDRAGRHAAEALEAGRHQGDGPGGADQRRRHRLRPRDEFLGRRRAGLSRIQGVQRPAGDGHGADHRQQQPRQLQRRGRDPGAARLGRRQSADPAGGDRRDPGMDRDARRPAADAACDRAAQGENPGADRSRPAAPAARRHARLELRRGGPLALLPRQRHRGRRRVRAAARRAPGHTGAGFSRPVSEGRDLSRRGALARRRRRGGAKACRGDARGTDGREPRRHRAAGFGGRPPAA